MRTRERTDAEIVFDEMSARQLAEIIRALSRDRGTIAAALTVSEDKDRNSIRMVVCAPLATSERQFAKMIAQEWHGLMEEHSATKERDRIVKGLRDLADVAGSESEAFALKKAADLVERGGL